MFYLFFFFQAEDGIRDRNVTGVQTCALPIYPCSMPRSPCHRAWIPSRDKDWRPNRSRDGRGRRSEERRVGKECRSLWAPEQVKKKGKDLIKKLSVTQIEQDAVHA